MAKVVIDTETGGLVPGFHEVLEICIVPLDDMYRPDPARPKFHTTVRPDHPERVDIGALIANGRVSRSSKDKEKDYALAMEAIMQYPTRRDTIISFVIWHKTVMGGEKLGWLCQNGSFDIPFLEHWFMPDHANGVSFRMFLNYQGRDTQRVAMWMMDRAKAAGKPSAISGVSLGKLTEHYGINHDDAHTSLGDCLATAAVYRKFLGID